MTKYRIVKTQYYDSASFKVQRKGWLFWSDEEIGCYEYSYPLTFRTEEEASLWVKKQVKPRETIVCHMEVN